MNDITSFLSNKRFLATKHFPRGLARSGEFTTKQSSLLEAHGVAYEALHNGERAPVNSEEQRFIDVCAGLEVAQSDHEKVWQRYCQAINKKPLISAFSSAQSQEKDESSIETDWLDIDET